MLLDVKSILHTPGKRLDFQFELDLSAATLSDPYPVSRPVSVSGYVRNTAGILDLDLTARTILDAACARCGKALSREIEIPFHCMLAESLENGENDEIELLENGTVDVGDLARTAFILKMDTKILCSEDCKGLCPRCGADLNIGPCSCRTEPDPRLAALAKLLENK